MSYRIRNCLNPECNKEFKQYNSLVKYCSGKCSIIHNGKPKSIKKISDRRKSEEIIYREKRLEFLSRPENLICPVTGKPTTDIHHKRKRRGFADEWAKENNISLLIDERFWLAVSREGHKKIEDNPTWAYEMGYSIKNNKK